MSLVKVDQPVAPTMFEWDEMLPTTPSSGATTGIGEFHTTTPHRSSLFGRFPRSQAFRGIMLSTMLPLVSVDEQIFRPRRDAFTVGGYVYLIDQEVLDPSDFSSIIAVYPNRRTFRFRGGRPARRLGFRLPFMPAFPKPTETED